MTKSFTLGQVLSITTGRLCCDIGDVYEILNHITGDSLFTHAIPRGSRFARPIILEVHPELSVASEADRDADLTRRIKEAEERGSDVMDAINGWLASLGLPQAIELESYESAWLSLDPMDELEGMVGKDKVVAVSADAPVEDAVQLIAEKK